MELLKQQENAEFKIGDITFYIRTQMTVRDKFEMDIIGEYVDGHFQMKKGALIYKLVELFVVGWNGVTEDSKPVPYSYETLITRLPGDASKDIIIAIGSFIIDRLKIGVKADDEKNA